MKLFQYSQYVILIAQLLFELQLPFVAYYIIKAIKKYLRSY